MSTAVQPNGGVQSKKKSTGGLTLSWPDPVPIIVPYAELGELLLDKTYQREVIKDWAYEIATVLMALGSTVPVALSKRPDGRIFIVDGQQRWWGHIQAGRDMHANLFTLPEPILESEKTLFQILNRHRSNTANNIVKGWPGPCAKMILHWINLQGSPYYGHTSVGGHGSSAYSASMLARAVCAALLSASSARGAIAVILQRLDLCITGANGHLPHISERSEAILRLIPLVFPPNDRARLQPVLAVADVACERWAKGVTGKFPKPTEQQRMRAINWGMLAPGYASHHFPTLRKAVEDRWRTGA